MSQREAQLRSATAVYQGEDRGKTWVFHSIEYSEIPGPFEFPRAKTPAAEEEPVVIDATRPRPERVALTIAVPTGAKFGADLPVVAFIHGGAYVEGSHEDFDLTGLAAHNVVAVSIDYRVGLEGFVHFHDDPPDHYRGIEDCLVALEWVQKEIECFGGDPTNVTLAGQSAGAGICLWLARTDHFRGLFRRLWALSPAFPRQPFAKRKGTLRRILGTPITRRHLTAKLQRHPRALRRGQRAFCRRFFTDVAFGPAPFDPSLLAEVPMLLSATRDEFYHDPTTTWLDAHGLGRVLVRLLAAHFGVWVPASSYLQNTSVIDAARPLSRLYGDAAVRRWVAQTAEQAPGQSWVFELTGTPEQPAVHCDDLPLIFGPGTGPQGGPEARGDHLLKLLVSFAGGQPPSWRPYRHSTRRAAARIDRDSGRITEASDPLKYVRLAFKPPKWR